MSDTIMEGDKKSYEETTQHMASRILAPGRASQLIFLVLPRREGPRERSVAAPSDAIKRGAEDRGKDAHLVHQVMCNGGKLNVSKHLKRGE